METKIKAKHNMTIESRGRALVTGVEKVLASSAKELSLVTSEGALEIRGEGLKISAYSEADGTLSFDGRIDRLEYAAAKKSLVKRIFK